MGARGEGVKAGPSPRPAPGVELVLSAQGSHGGGAADGALEKLLWPCENGLEVAELEVRRGQGGLDSTREGGWAGARPAPALEAGRTRAWCLGIRTKRWQWPAPRQGGLEPRLLWDPNVLSSGQFWGPCRWGECQGVDEVTREGLGWEEHGASLCLLTEPLSLPVPCFLFPLLLPGQVLELLKVAWKRRLIFTVGTSSTTGETDTVVWNEIHHKTEMDRNVTGHGYPDPNYLQNVLAELAAQGVTEDCLEQQ